MVFLKEVMSIQLPKDIIQEVTARTEGWLVGLQLLGLSLQGYTDPADLLDEVSGSQRYILDYLMEEVLRRQPPAMQRMKEGPEHYSSFRLMTLFISHPILYESKSDNHRRTCFN